MASGDTHARAAPRPLRQAVALTLLGCALGVGADLVLPRGALGRLEAVLRDLELVVPVHLERPEEVARGHAAGELILVDARSPEQFAAEHVAGSVHVPGGRVGERFDDLAELVADRRVVVILPSEDVEAARRLAQEVVTDLGAASAATIEGGWEALRVQGLPLEAGGETP